MKFEVILTSEAYGTEAFEGYGTSSEAEEARSRIQASASSLNDGVARTYEIVVAKHPRQPRQDTRHEAQLYATAQNKFWRK